MKKIILPLAAGILLFSCSLFKNTKGSKPVVPGGIARADTVKKDTAKKIKPYREVITPGAITQKGLFQVHKVNDRWFFEIADSLLNKDILVVNRISKAAAGVRMVGGLIGYGGDQIGENVVQFSKGPNQKIFIRRISHLEVSKDSSDNGMYRSVLNSNVQSIAASFDIKAVSPGDAGSVIDVTDYLNTDNDVFFFNPLLKKAIQLGGLQADKSYIDRIRSFPLNTEIKTIKTYQYSDQLLTYELNSSLVLLPSTVMQPRYFDERVGFFSRGYLNYDEPQGVKANFMITRWKLEPAARDIDKYLRGQLVEPQKPIVFYIDPATPKKWVPYIMQGVKDWQKAFEKAGFRNAIYALEAPVDDTTWSMEDARHNVIVYKASPLANASGPQVHDPRSGQILESHINWYHNVQEILHDWYFIQAAPNDPRARNMEYDDALMGRLIQYVCTHEVGHTLGLQHNFAASASIPVDSLRSRRYVAENSHTPSIMDYARFNYVAQPEDGIAVNDLVPRIGVYDEWAIEWGYRWLPPFKTPAEEKTYMNKWVVRQLQKDKRCFFEQNMSSDPRNQMEDLGDDAVKAGRYGIQNLQVVEAHLKQWAITPDNNYDDLLKLNRAVWSQYARYIDHATKQIRYMYSTPQTGAQGGPYFSFPTRERIREAVAFLNEQLFATPGWLVNNQLFTWGAGGGVITLTRVQEHHLYHLVYPATWNWLVFNETSQPKEKSYSYDQLLNDLEAGIWSELEGHQPIDIYRRNVQKMYVYDLIDGMKTTKVGDMRMNDCSTILLYHMKNLANKIDRSLAGYTDRASIMHLEDLSSRLKKGVTEHYNNIVQEFKSININPAGLTQEKLQVQTLKPDNNRTPWNGKGCWEGSDLDEYMFPE
jgi:hypothetical protein